LHNNYRSCPEEYRELRRRNDEVTSDVDDNDDTDDDEPRENICEQAMKMIVKNPQNIAKLDPLILLTYCPHYDERLALVRANNNTLCENKKQELIDKQKRQQSKREQDDGFNASDDDDQRRALRRKELTKRFAFRFIRKRMS
jgi:hypothetical protein